MAKVETKKKVNFSLSEAAAGRNPIGRNPIKEKTPAEKAAASKDYERFNFICSSELVKKAKAISRKEGFTIRALMEKAMTDFFAKYEAKNGEVGELITKKIDDVL